MLMDDFHFREKMFHFDHERIPERVVHARGFAAHGYFECLEDLSDITRAAVFKKGEKTPVFTRFSTVAGNKGSPDVARDVRGFATKFYTKEGNWDLVGNNIPVFFIQDAIKFPDLIHAAKPAPDRGFPQAQTAHDNFWDFISLSPEAMNMVMWIMSDRTIPRSLRFMEGFGVHTFRLINAEGKSTFVKFHWKPKQGLQSVVWNEALKINGADPDFHRRDMWDAIQTGDYPEWELGMQLFDEEFAEEGGCETVEGGESREVTRRCERCPYRVEEPQFLEGELVCETALMLGGQMRFVGGMGGAGPTGLDMNAALALGDVRRCDMQLLADVLPALERALVAQHQRDDDCEEGEAP